MLDMDFGAGFADPVRDAQAAFRAILDALANPGTLQALPAPAQAVHGMEGELVSTLLTLADHDTSLWLSPTLKTGTTPGFVAFHTGAVLTETLSDATFAFIAAADDLPPLEHVNPGSQDYPDRSTTIVKALPSLTGGTRRTLRGPGIRDSITIDPQGLPQDFNQQWAANRSLFPRGADLLLVANGAVLGLPRSTRIAED